MKIEELIEQWKKQTKASQYGLMIDMQKVMKEELKKVNNTHKTNTIFFQNLIYKIITKLIMIQDEIEYNQEIDDNKIYDIIWWVIEEAKDRLKEIFNKV